LSIITEPEIPRRGIDRIETGIPGIDPLTYGGLPEHRTTLVAGPAGSGKTIMSVQFLLEGIRHYDHPGVFVGFGETPADIIRNVASFGWDIQKKIDNDMWRFVDCSPTEHNDEEYLGGDFDLAALRSRIVHAIEKIGAKRVSVDSIATLFQRFPNPGVVRRELSRLTRTLRDAGVTAVVTAERDASAHVIGRFGVEEFVADNIIVVDYRREQNRRRRTLEVLKLRGGDHASGEYPFTITYNGINAIPIGTLHLENTPSTNERIKSGNDDLDAMCGGGFFQDSVTLIAGATGTGKTMTAMEFLRGGGADTGKVMLWGYEESRPQLIRNASSWGIDLEQMEADGLLEIHCQFPESGSLEDHLTAIRDGLDRFQPKRVVVDSLSALERIGSEESFREFVIGLTSIIKQRQVAGLYTTTDDKLFGGSSVTGKHISTLTDAIIMLRYVEVDATIKRGITVIKMRGSGHDHKFREFQVTSDGLRIGEAFGDQVRIFGDSC
jgi:circadian clock protein KaiC